MVIQSHFLTFLPILRLNVIMLFYHLLFTRQVTRRWRSWSQMTQSCWPVWRPRRRWRGFRIGLFETAATGPPLSPRGAPLSGAMSRQLHPGGWRTIWSLDILMLELLSFYCLVNIPWHLEFQLNVCHKISAFIFRLPKEAFSTFILHSVNQLILYTLYCDVLGLRYMNKIKYSQYFWPNAS